jgi:hypothetical protein
MGFAVAVILRIMQEAGRVHHPIAADIKALSQLTDLPIPAQYHEGVAVQLTALQEQAELVLGLPLEPTVEPAPVFTP